MAGRDATDWDRGGEYQGFTQRARRAIGAARDEAERLGVGYVGSEHLLLGLLRDPRDAAAMILAARGIDLERTRAEVRRRSERARSGPGSGERGITPGARRALQLAMADAREWQAATGGTSARADAVDTVNLLMGVVRAAEGVSAEVLRALGVEPGEGTNLLRREIAGTAVGVSASGATASGATARTELQTASCPSCGRPVRAGWRHCIYCGATLREGCPRCGATLQHVPGEAYCHECGAQLQPTTDAPTVPLEGDEPRGE
jgi:ATP-dependent Clp protease ATP-binding subunit ClpC